MKEKLKEKGITLTALVVTIIILLILATITIRAITGDNGIIRKTSEAVNAYKIAENKEQETLEYLYGELNPNQEITITMEILNDIIDKKINESKKEDKLNAYPIGSIYISTEETNPSKLFGGTWESYGQGKTLIGAGTGTDENGETKTFTANTTGGEYSHKLTIEEMPSHTHIQNAHVHAVSFDNGTDSLGLEGGYVDPNKSMHLQGHAVAGARSYTLRANPTIATNQNTGGSQSHNIMQSYIVTYMWKRIE